ncbi:MAG: methylaspartate mutase subunit S, partial [Fusobacteriaceae bacterium]
VEARFKGMGFNRVYRPGTPIELTTEDLKKDLGI